jgi:hypothetical protein
MLSHVFTRTLVTTAVNSRPDTQGIKSWGYFAGIFVINIKPANLLQKGVITAKDIKDAWSVKPSFNGKDFDALVVDAFLEQNHIILFPKENCALRQVYLGQFLTEPYWVVILDNLSLSLWKEIEITT